MNFLKKLGGVLARIAGVSVQTLPLVSAVAGAVAAAAPTNTTVKQVSGEISAIGGVISNVEGAFQAAASDPNAKTGADKLKVAAPLVGNIIRSSELLAGKTVKDPEAFDKSVTAITSAFADLIGALDVAIEPKKEAVVASAAPASATTPVGVA